MNPIMERTPGAPKVDDPWGLTKKTDVVSAVPTELTAAADDGPPPVAPRRRAAWIAVTAVVVAAVGAATYALALQWRESQAEAALGMLILSSHPSDARVTVNGQPAGTTPVALRLTAGPHAVVVTAPTGVFEQFSADVTAGGSTARHVALVAPAAVATTGALAIDAAPAGGEVFVDGARVGIAPMTVAGLAPGEHVVQLRRAAVTSERRIAVVAGAVTALVFAAPPTSGAAGWISFTLPFDVQVFEGTTYVGSNRGDRILVSAGRHTFDLVNESLQFRSQRSVVVAPGQTARLAVDVPQGTLSVNAQPWANVTVGGRDFGETPLANLSLPIGTHEMTLRHPTLGERRQPVTIRLGAPNRVSVDLRK